MLGENGPGEKHSKLQGVTPHFVTSSVEHDSVRLPLEHLVRENMAGECMGVAARELHTHQPCSF